MQAQLEATLAKLISIPSVTSNPVACHEIISYVRAEIEPLGLFITESDEDAPNPWFYATTQKTKTPDVLLAAHLDIVPAPPEMFIMQKHGEKLHGRGVYDMKFAAACYLELLKTHVSELHNLNIGVLFTSDEEGTGRCTIDILETGLRPKAVFLPDGGDNWTLEKRAKGLYGLELTATGKAAHGSRPWEGDNALHTILDVVQTLRSKYPSTLPTGTTLAVNKLRAGETANQIADYASVMIDFRSFDKQDIANYKRLIAEMVKKHNLKMNTIATGAPLLFDAKNPGVQSFLKALRGFTGSDDITYSESYGATDGRFFAEYDIPCIIIEPFGGGRHAEKEWLQAEDLSRYYRLIEQWLFPQPVTAHVETEKAAIALV